MDVDLLVRKAGDAFKAGNVDTAYELMSHCLGVSPNDGQMFDLFHTMASKRGSGFLSRALGPISSLIMGQILKGLGKPVGAMKAFHKALWKNPQSVSALKQFASAAVEGENYDTAMMALTKAQELKPRDISITRQLGHACWKAKRFKAAQKCFYDIQRLRPSDKEASRALHDLAADATIDEGHYDEAHDFRQSVRDEEVQKRLHDEGRAVVTEDDVERAIGNVLTEIEASPEKISNYLRLAELHGKQGDWGKARDALGKGLKVAPQSNDLLQAVSQLEVTQRREQTEAVRKRLEADPENAELAGELKRLEEASLAFEMEEVEKLIQANPTSTDLRMRMGDLCMRAGETDKAIGSYQRCVNDPRRRLRALVQLGKAMSAKGMYDLAARQFETVNGEVEVMNDLKKETTYELGLALEASGKLAEALDCYQTVYEVDITYREVASKVEALYNKVKRSKEPEPEG